MDTAPSEASSDEPCDEQELLGDRLWKGQDPTDDLELAERRVEPPRQIDLRGIRGA